MAEAIDLAVTWGGAIAVALVAVLVRDLYVYGKRWRTDFARKIAENRLEKLYSPLMAIIKAAEAQYGTRTIMIADRSGSDNLKASLDAMMRNYYYLASAELKPFLALIYDAGFYVSKVDSDKLVATIERDFEGLEKVYYGRGGGKRARRWLRSHNA